MKLNQQKEKRNNLKLKMLKRMRRVIKKRERRRSRKSILRMKN